MRPFGSGADPGGFFAGLAEAPARVLMLDYDGTLAPFVEERDRAIPYPGVREAVAELLSAGHTRVVVVSGRAVDDLRPLLGIEPAPEIWGTHGWERYRPGEGTTLAEPGEEARGRLEEGRRAALDLADPGAVEVKPVSVAVHVRGRPADEAERLLDRVQRAWSPLVDDGTLEVHSFDGGLELRVPGRDKGTAVDGILAGTPDGTACAYLGDDLTDEDAFGAVLRHGGLPVLARGEPRPDTRAVAWLRPPDELLAFLARWNEAVEPE